MIKNLLIFFLIFLLLITTNVEAKPKIKALFGHSLQGFARVKVINETTTELACYVAINGFKKKFRLPPLKESKWFAATDKNFNYRHFSTWCDYIDLYPAYKKYNTG